MKWVTSDAWETFINSENTPRERALADFAIRVAKNKDPIESLRSAVEKLQDADANNQFEIVRFNYEFLHRKKLETEAASVKSALSNFEKVDKKCRDYQRRQEKLEADWLEKCRRAEELCAQIDGILNPRQSVFSHRKNRLLSFANLDSKSFLEQNSYFWRLIEELRDSANRHMRVSGAIAVIRPMEELRQIMLQLESISPKFSRSAKCTEELKQNQEKFHEEVSVLMRTLSGIGEFALYALSCLYIKLVHPELKNSSTLSEVPPS